MLGYTGTYRDMPVSVMGTGMGIPSISIYATELIAEYGVKRLVRVGSCGGIADDLEMRDVVIAIGASTDSLVNRRRYAGFDFAATADFELLSAAVAAARVEGVSVRVGNVHTGDLFYGPDPHTFEVMKSMGVLAVEMETAGLYGLAAERGARALSILTVSDHLGTGEVTTAEERQTTFDAMIRVALEALRRDTG